MSVALPGSLIVPASSGRGLPGPLGEWWAWYDFSDTATVTLDGFGNIAAVLDKTGRGHTLAQAVAAQRPTPGVLNGLPCASFTSALETVLESADPVADPLAQPQVVFIVWTQDVAPGGGTYWPGPIIGGANLHCQNTNDQLVISQGAGNVSMHIFPLAPFTQCCDTMILDGGSSSLRRNGAATGGALPGGTWTRTVLGAQQWPYFAGQNDGLDGKIGEVIIAYGSITTPQLLAVETYLRNKWGTP